MNLRPSGYEPDELPGCSTPRQGVWIGMWREQVTGFTGGIGFERMSGWLVDLAATYSPTS